MAAVFAVLAVAFAILALLWMRLALRAQEQVNNLLEVHDTNMATIAMLEETCRRWHAMFTKEPAE